MVDFCWNCMVILTEINSVQTLIDESSISLLIFGIRELQTKNMILIDISEIYSYSNAHKNLPFECKNIRVKKRKPTKSKQSFSYRGQIFTLFLQYLSRSRESSPRD